MSPTDRRNRRRFALAELWVAGSSVVSGAAGYLLHASALEFCALMLGAAALAFTIARQLLLAD